MVRHSFDPGATRYTPEDRTTVGIEVSARWKGVVHEDMYITTKKRARVHGTVSASRMIWIITT